MDKKDCVYCNHGEPLNDIANSNFAICMEQDNGEHAISIEYDDSYEHDESWVDINFCPMCGRKFAQE